MPERIGHNQQATVEPVLELWSLIRIAGIHDSVLNLFSFAEVEHAEFFGNKLG